MVATITAEVYFMVQYFAVVLLNGARKSVDHIRFSVSGSATIASLVEKDDGKRVNAVVRQFSVQPAYVSLLDRIASK